MPGYDKTQLNPKATFERHVYHRDQFAHYLRWTHVLKRVAKLRNKGTILDVGCGSGNLFEVLYRNRMAPKEYVGIDVRDRTINKLQIEWEHIDWAKFKTHDIITSGAISTNDGWDLITSLEVFEHIGKSNGDSFLKAIESVMSEETTFLMSTPVYDEQVGAAGNHTYDCGDGNGVIPQEWGYGELKELLEKHFYIEATHGTFASQKDIKPVLTSCEQAVYDKLSKYYDSNLISVLMAPLHPAQSRNCIWTLKKK